MRKHLTIALMMAAVSLRAYGQCNWITDTTWVSNPCRVGVGMSTQPSFPVHVHLGSNVNFLVRPGSDWTSGSGASIDALNDAMNARLAMFIGGNPTVFNGGNVGIGTVSPGEKLEVAGNGRFGLDFGTMPAPQYGGVMIGQYGAGGIGELQFLSAASANGYGFRLHGYAGDGSLRLDRRANSTTWSDFMTFKADGRIGIGVMEPGSSLTVAGVVESTSGGVKFPDGSIQATAFPLTNGTLSTSGSNVGIGTVPANRLHVYATGVADGMALDGTNSPAINFRNAGALKGYFGLATVAGGFFTNSSANDLAIRSEANNILLGQGAGVATLAVVGRNIGVGLTTPTTYINTDAWFKPDVNGTNVAIYSTGNEAVLNAISNQDADGAHIGGLYFTRSAGQTDAHRQVAAIQGRQVGTGTLAGGDLWFFTKPAGGGSGVDNGRMVIKSTGNIGIGLTAPASRLDVGGNIHATGDISADGQINAKYQDVAEWVDASSDLEPGTVVVLDPSHDNRVMPSRAAYDTAVAGVVSSTPGLVLGVKAAGMETIATTGRVKVKVDAARAPIAIGDLLVTSDVAGTAMKSEPIDVGGTKIHRPGTVVGKALQAFSDGQGEILVLLSLQ
ncbi:MAG: hypothetical protein AABO58_24015 [Acidobacteriota bacterium]